MKIRLAVIPVEDLPRVRIVVDSLRDASNSGDMGGVDAMTEELLSLSGSLQYIDLEEKQWRDWLAEIRTAIPAFQSDYLISSDLCSGYFPAATSETVVLQLPIDDRESDDV